MQIFFIILNILIIGACAFVLNELRKQYDAWKARRTLLDAYTNEKEVSSETCIAFLKAMVSDHFMVGRLLHIVIVFTGFLLIQGVMFAVFGVLLSK
jgi:hypothetical protein